jgi:glycosyltransferase involved in cell wall biosynthesis
MHTKTHILFISHEASQTGAPIVLLHLLHWLKEHTDLVPIVLLREGGVLQAEFENIAQTFIWKRELPTSVWKHRLQRLANIEQKHQRQVAKQIHRLKPKLIYANTAVTAELALNLNQILHCPIVCHVHELQLIIQESIGNKKFNQISAGIDCFIAASEAVSINLINNYNISSLKIEKVHEFVPVLENINFKESRSRIRQELLIPDDTLLVIASGTLEWRKSPEMFIQVAQKVQDLGGKMPYFIWLGGSLDSYFGIRSQYDLVRSGVSSKVTFLGAKKNAHDYISAADIFVLTSREDPYPLVCLEAASLGKPIICFADSGGMPEFVEHDCGVVVPYLRTDLLAEAIIELRDDRDKRVLLGNNAASKMRAKHTVDIAASQIYTLLMRMVKD